MNKERLLKVLVAPHISDKAYRVQEKNNEIVFKVLTCATKAEIKKAVELVFEKNVERVRTVVVKGKARRFGATQGRTKDWKKAYVKLQDGQTIDFVGEK